MKREQLPFSFDAVRRRPKRKRATTAIDDKRVHPYAATERGQTEQMRLDFERSEELARLELEMRLGALMTRPIALVVTDNTRTMISTQRQGGALRVRLHHMFVHADERIVRALARYLRRSDAESSAMLGDYIRENDHRIRTREQRPTIRLEGAHHDLVRVFSELNARYFGERVEATVTWGNRAPKRARRRHGRSIRLGSYCEADRLIRIHPALDQAWVPDFFVRFVMFHEMLHHVFPARISRGRTRFHSAEFRAAERSYPEYERAIRWEHENVDRLLVVASRS